MSGRQRRQPGQGPALIPTAAEPELQELTQLPQELEEQLREGEEEVEQYRLLYPGAQVEASITLAVDFGDGKTNFLKYAASDLVQEHEDHPQAYGRMATVTIDGCMRLIDDTQAALEEYEKEQRAKRAAVERQTSGR